MILQLALVVYAYNPSTQEKQVEGLGVQGYLPNLKAVRAKEKKIRYSMLTMLMGKLKQSY